jgi:hypothetical protein
MEIITNLGAKASCHGRCTSHAITGAGDLAVAPFVTNVLLQASGSCNLPFGLAILHLKAACTCLELFSYSAVYAMSNNLPPAFWQHLDVSPRPELLYK